MVYFDFIYYLISKFYSAFNERGAESTSAAIVGGLQAFNALTILILLSIVFQKNIGINKVVGISLFLIFQVFTYVRYFYIEKYSIVAIERKWLGKTDIYRRQFQLVSIVYVLLSIISMVGLAIMLGSRA